MELRLLVVVSPTQPKLDGDILVIFDDDSIKFQLEILSDQRVALPPLEGGTNALA